LSDAEVLAWLDRLLDLEVAERERQLQQLASGDPGLHARLVRLLGAALDLESSHIVARPVAEGFRAVREAAALSLETGQAVAGYRLLRELGRGGMSVVWLAERADGVVKRQVALKLPLFVLSSPLDVERFAREKDVLAALTHPHIARLYDAGVAATGQPFIVLEFVDGISITDWCDRNRCTIEQRLSLFLQVLAAVDHAHKHLVVHRDLKPSNILVDEQGQVKLLDFGIARLLTDPKAGAAPVLLTRHGDLALTPLYAAPEQLSAQPITVFTDVYVLGVVLHELLSGAHPYADAVGSAPGLARVLDAVLRGTPTRPSHAPIDERAAQARGLHSARRLRAALAGDLDTIVRKAMSHEPAQRYDSAGQFAEDARRFRARRPISARPPNHWYSARLFLRRHRNASIAAACGVLLALSAGAIALYQAREARLYEARSAAVRDFMFDLVNDAEPSESQPDAPITFQEMLGGAVVRARTTFQDEPQLEGELLNELGRMYRRLGDSETSARVLSESLALLEAHAPRDDPALNKARANVATALLDENELERARALATAAKADCTRRGVDCAKARAYACSVLATIQQRDGNSSLAMASMREAVEETIRGFGQQHEETALMLLSLAITARNTGHLREAMEAMTRAMAMSANLTLRKNDRTELSRTMAVLDLDMGQYAEACRRLQELLTHTTDRNERALQLRLLANVLLEQGDPQPALESSDAALSLAVDDVVEALYARQNRARALAMLGQPEQSLAQIKEVMAGLAEAGFSDDAQVVLRARRYHAEILLRTGHANEALSDLEVIERRLLAMPERRDIELGQILDLMGCALRELRREPDAMQAHATARSYFLKELPPTHPFLQRNTLYRDVEANDTQKIRRDAPEIIRGMSPTSYWRQLIAVQIQAGTVRATDSQSRIFIL